MSDVTQILSQIEQGDPKAAEELLPLVYDELRKLAAARLAHEKPGQTLEATALVHEAYLRLMGGGVWGSGLAAEGRVSQELPLIPNPESRAPTFNDRPTFSEPLPKQCGESWSITPAANAARNAAATEFA